MAGIPDDACYICNGFKYTWPPPSQELYFINGGAYYKAVACRRCRGTGKQLPIPASPAREFPRVCPPPDQTLDTPLLGEVPGAYMGTIVRASPTTPTVEVLIPDPRCANTADCAILVENGKEFCLTCNK